MNTTDMSTVMDFFVDHRVNDLPSDALAEVFDRLIWCTEDNGGAICEVRERWLLSDDHDRVAIALAMSETFPFRKVADMRVAFDQIVNRWPEFRARCDEIAAARGDKE